MNLGTTLRGLPNDEQLRLATQLWNQIAAQPGAPACPSRFSAKTCLPSAGRGLVQRGQLTPRETTVATRSAHVMPWRGRGHLSAYVRLNVEAHVSRCVWATLATLDFALHVKRFARYGTLHDSESR